MHFVAPESHRGCAKPANPARVKKPFFSPLGHGLSSTLDATPPAGLSFPAKWVKRLSLRLIKGPPAGGAPAISRARETIQNNGFQVMQKFEHYCPKSPSPGMQD